MGIYIRVAKIEQLCCPKCGSRRIAGLQQEYCHCGQCGMPLQIHMPQDEWQRADMLWKNSVIKEQEKGVTEEETESIKEVPIAKAVSKEAAAEETPSEAAVLEQKAETNINKEIDTGTDTDEVTDLDLEDAGMIFRPDLEEAEWEFEPVYEQLSFFPFPE